MTSRRIEAGQAFVRMGTRGNVETGLKKGRRAVLALGAAIASVTSVAAAFVGKFAKFGDTIQKMSLRTGVSTEALSGLKFAAEQSGADIETLEKGIRRLQASLFDLERGGDASEDAFAAIGLTLRDLRGLAPEKQFEKVAEGIAGVADASRKAAIAQQIFGRSGTMLLPLLNEGAAGMAKLRAEAEELGLVISKEQADKAAALTDAINRARRAWEGFLVQTGAEFADDFLRVLEQAVRLLKEVRKIREELGDFGGIPSVADISNRAVLGVGGAALAERAGVTLFGTTEELIIKPLSALGEEARETAKRLAFWRGKMNGFAEVFLNAGNAQQARARRAELEAARNRLPEAFGRGLGPRSGDRIRDLFGGGLAAGAGAIVDAAAAAEGRIEGLGAAFAEVEQQVQAGASGTFGAAEARRLGRTSDVDQRQLEVMQRSERLLEGVRRLLERGGLRWGA